MFFVTFYRLTNPLVRIRMEMDKLLNIPDGKPVRIFLPLIDRKDRYRVNCIFQKETLPHFLLQFKIGELPYEQVDTEECCFINIDIGGTTLSLKGKIEEIVGVQTLRLVATKIIDHEQLREFFRVDATTQVISKSFQPKVSDQQNDGWSVQGTTVDISGSGLLAVFPTLPPMDEQVSLEIVLPSDEGQVIHVLAKPIRSEKIREDYYEVAYHFEEIKLEDRDLIIKNCLVIQRQLLRMKVQVKDY